MEKIKFKHLRYFGKYGEVSNLGGITIAYVVKDDNINYSMAYCSENDNFSKKLGRTIAAGRLNSTRYLNTFAGSEEDFHSNISYA